MMNSLDAVGHIAYLFTVGGTLLLASKLRIGWLLRLIGEAGWIVLGWLMGYTSIWIWSTVFLVIDLVGFVRWKDEDETSECEGKGKKVATACSNCNCRKVS